MDVYTPSNWFPRSSTLHHILSLLSARARAAHGWVSTAATPWFTPTPSPTLLTIIHGSRWVAYTGLETYVAVTVLRSNNGESYVPDRVRITLVRRTWRNMLSWILGPSEREEWDVTPAVEFGRAPMEALVPPPTEGMVPTSPKATRRSLSTPTSPQQRRTSLRSRSRKTSRSLRDGPEMEMSSLRHRRPSSTTSSTTLQSGRPMIQPRTSFPPQQLATYEAQPRLFIQRWNNLHPEEPLIPVATHVVRVPNCTRDGYFHLLVSSTSSPSSGSEESVASPMFRIWSLTPPWGVMSGAPLFPPLLLLEVLVWTGGTAVLWGVRLASFLPRVGLKIVGRIIRPILTRVTGERVPLPSEVGIPPQKKEAREDRLPSVEVVKHALTLASMGVRQRVLDLLDSEYGRGGVSYWR